MKAISLMLPLLLGLAACETIAGRPTEAQTIGLGETARFDGFRVTASRVVEDSRCATGVQCIQAGTVRLEVRAGGGVALLSLGVPVRMGSRWLSLTRACPYPVHGVPIRPADYRFTLLASLSDTPAPVHSEGCPPSGG